MSRAASAIDDRDGRRLGLVSRTAERFESGESAVPLAVERLMRVMVTPERKRLKAAVMGDRDPDPLHGHASLAHPASAGDYASRTAPRVAREIDDDPLDPRDYNLKHAARRKSAAPPAPRAAARREIDHEDPIGVHEARVAKLRAARKDR